MSTRHYTAEEIQRIASKDIEEVMAHFRRLAEDQRPAVRRAIAALCGTPEDTEQR